MNLITSDRQLIICLKFYQPTDFDIFPCHQISGGNGATGAIAGGVAAGAALLFAAPAIAFALWRRRKPQEFFFDVPGLCFE